MQLNNIIQHLLSIEIYFPWCLPCHVTCGVERKGVLNTVFDRVRQHMSLPPNFLLRQVGRT